METKKSTCSRVVHNSRSYNGKYGTMFIHLVEFDNGDKGEYHSKTDSCTKFTEGQEHDYTIEKRTNGQYENIIIKPVQENTYTKKTNGSNASFALSYAKDIACAKIATMVAQTDEDIIKRADMYYNWLESKK